MTKFHPNANSDETNDRRDLSQGLPLRSVCSDGHHRCARISLLVCGSRGPTGNFLLDRLYLRGRDERHDYPGLPSRHHLLSLALLSKEAVLCLECPGEEIPNLLCQ